VLPSGDTLASAPGAGRAGRAGADARDTAPADDVPIAEPGAFLFDPSPAVTRAGLVEDLARLLGAWKIDPAIAFLSDDREHRSPFARTLRVLESAPWHERDFARRLRELGIGAADIRRRGLAGTLVWHAGRYGREALGAGTFVIVADPADVAIRVYRACGFADTQRQFGFERPAED